MPKSKRRSRKKRSTRKKSSSGVEQYMDVAGSIMKMRMMQQLASAGEKV